MDIAAYNYLRIPSWCVIANVKVLDPWYDSLPSSQAYIIRGVMGFVINKIVCRLNHKFTIYMHSSCVHFLVNFGVTRNTI